jgi:hypothetical protein
MPSWPNWENSSGKIQRRACAVCNLTPRLWLPMMSGMSNEDAGKDLTLEDILHENKLLLAAKKVIG